MPLRVDHVADASGAELFQLAQRYEFPDFVKQADMDQTFRPVQLAVTAYADPVRQQFPCHSAAATWLSALYFTEKAAEFHPKDQTRIWHRLNHYVDYWRINGDVLLMRAKHAAYKKARDSALPDTSYAWVHVDPQTGHKDRHLRLTNAAEIKAAAEYLQDYRDTFSFKTRHGMARRILEKAGRYGAALPNREFLEKQAGMGVCDPAQVVAMLRDRAHLAKDAGLCDMLVKLAETVAQQPRQALHPSLLAELAATVDTVDQKLGIHGHYSRDVPRPEDVIFAATLTKAASDLAEHCALTSGKVYKKADFARLELSAVESLFGTDFANQVKRGVDNVDAEKMAELVTTLPLPDAELFDRLMADCGLRPQLVKAASARRGFAEADWAALAQTYTPAR